MHSTVIPSLMFNVMFFFSGSDTHCWGIIGKTSCCSVPKSGNLVYGSYYANLDIIDVFASILLSVFDKIVASILCTCHFLF